MHAALLLAAAAPLSAGPPPPAPWEAVPVRTDAEDVPASSYRVRAGDTLSHVVARTHAAADAIARANRLAPPYRLRPGQLLSIPPGRYHRVRSGEAGIAIGRAYGLDWSRIATLNHLEPPYQLRAGDRLLLPPREAGQPLTLEERAARFHIDLDDLVTGSAPALGRSARPVAPKAARDRPAPADRPVATPARPFSGQFAAPVDGKVVRAFGGTEEGGRNDGVDLATRSGEPIRAAADGVVAWAGRYPAFGPVILVNHGGGWVTIYARVGDLLVERGQAVTRGQAIARAAGPLHFEIRSGRRPVDPLPLLR